MREPNFGKSGKNVCRKFKCENRGSQRGGAEPLEGPASILRCATSLGWRRPKSRAFCVFSSPKTRRWLFEGISPPPHLCRREGASKIFGFRERIVKIFQTRHFASGKDSPSGRGLARFYIPEPFRPPTGTCVTWSSDQDHSLRRRRSRKTGGRGSSRFIDGREIALRT